MTEASREIELAWIDWCQAERALARRLRRTHVRHRVVAAFHRAMERESWNAAPAAMAALGRPGGPFG